MLAVVENIYSGTFSLLWDGATRTTEKAIFLTEDMAIALNRDLKTPSQTLHQTHSPPRTVLIVAC
jgi:hypothetical protein